MTALAPPDRWSRISLHGKYEPHHLAAVKIDYWTASITVRCTNTVVRNTEVLRIFKVEPAGGQGIRARAVVLHRDCYLQQRRTGVVVALHAGRTPSNKSDVAFRNRRIVFVDDHSWLYHGDAGVEMEQCDVVAQLSVRRGEIRVDDNAGDSRVLEAGTVRACADQQVAAVSPDHALCDSEDEVWFNQYPVADVGALVGQHLKSWLQYHHGIVELAW
ncbi:hypothetical protein M8818_000986 [Zalaria obscura]|uniref:Uncharacterized protein n=1 Tax=Zalaria obscura TaxID=2024903 RepID=A0ACC3SM69_9PEZI